MNYVRQFPPLMTVMVLICVHPIRGAAVEVECEDLAAGARTDAGAMLSPPPWVEPGMAQSVWRLAEAAAAAEDKDLRKCLLLEAEEDARLALSEDETATPRRFALAAVLGMRANAEGGRTKVRAAAELNEQLRAILDVEPEHARARHMLGRLHAGVRRMNRVTRWLATNLLGGATLKEATWEEAERNLSFAEQVAPEVADHHLQLANLYRDTKRPELALEEVVHVLELPAESPMADVARAGALKLAEELGG